MAPAHFNSSVALPDPGPNDEVPVVAHHHITQNKTNGPVPRPRQSLARLTAEP
jgi:hypothetical protein